MTTTRLLEISNFGPFFDSCWEFVPGDCGAGNIIEKSTNYQNWILHTNDTIVSNAWNRCKYLFEYFDFAISLEISDHLLKCWRFSSAHFKNFRDNFHSFNYTILNLQFTIRKWLFCCPCVACNIEQLDLVVVPRANTNYSIINISQWSKVMIVNWIGMIIITLSIVT